MEKEIDLPKKNDCDAKSGSNSSNKSYSSVEFLKTELLTIEDMKKASYDKSIKIMHDENNELYDLNEEANFLKIVKILNDDSYSNKDKIKNFIEIMYKLSYTSRIELLKQYKDLFDQDEKIKKFNNSILRKTKSLKEVFISILNDIINKEAETVKNSFYKDYYIDMQSSNIPYLEGSEEFIFANLINDVFDTFIAQSELPSDEIDKRLEENYLSNIICSKLQKPVIKPAKIINKKDKDKNDIPNKMEIEENNTNKSKKDEVTFVKSKYQTKKYLLKPIFERYCSEEFQNKYEEYLSENQELKKDKKIKYIYEIIIESLFFYCLYFNENAGEENINNYANIFYEYERSKIDRLSNSEFIIYIKDMNDKDIDLSQGLKNTKYRIKINNYAFDINFYDYNIEKLFRKLDYVDKTNDKNIKNILDNMEYWTIQKFIRVNSLYNDETLNKLFKQDINKMLKHTVLENVFNGISMSKDYIYPFKREEFLNQVHESILYIKLPTKLILGLTIKKMGIIIINKGRFNELINRQNDKNVKFALKLSESAFNKITLLHEINFHYFLVILFSNKSINELDTPNSIFQDYDIDEPAMDFGDQGESILFGNKVSSLYINGIINILNLKYWDDYCEKGEKELPKIGEKFWKLNKKTKKKITVEDLKKINEFTLRLYTIIEKDKMSNTSNFKPKKNLSSYFFKGKIEDDDCEQIDESVIDSNTFATILPRGICLNACKYYK